MLNNYDKPDRSVLKHSAIISTVVLIGKVIGFLKQTVIAWAFGANALTDIYFAADGYTSMFGQIMGSSVGPTVLTSYVKLEEEGKKEAAKKIIRESYFFFGIIGILLVVLNIAFSATICDFIGISYSYEQKKELLYFLILLCPVIIFTSLSGVSSGYLDGNRRFIPSKLCSFFFSLSIIVGVFFFRQSLGLKSLLYSFLFGYALHTLYMLFLVVPTIGVFFSNPFKDVEFCSMITRFIPVVIGNSIVDLGLLINKIVASSLESGSVSALYYGQVISSDLVNSVIITSVGTVLLTSLTETVSKQKNNKDIKRKLQYIICVMTVITGLITVLYIVENIDLIRLFFERGKFNSQNTNLVSSIASLYALGFVFMANREVLIKAHYAYQDTVSPMKNSIIGVIVNVAGCIILTKYLGVSGVACATSISMVIVAFLSLFTLKKHVGSFLLDKTTVKDILKVLVSIIITVFIGKIVFDFLINWLFLSRMILVSVIIVFIYTLILLFLREKVTVNFILKLAKKIS